MKGKHWVSPNQDSDTLLPGGYQRSMVDIFRLVKINWTLISKATYTQMGAKGYKDCQITHTCGDWTNNSWYVGWLHLFFVEKTRYGLPLNTSDMIVHRLLSISYIYLPYHPAILLYRPITRYTPVQVHLDQDQLRWVATVPFISRRRASLADISSLQNWQKYSWADMCLFHIFHQLQTYQSSLPRQTLDSRLHWSHGPGAFSLFNFGKPQFWIVGLMGLILDEPRFTWRIPVMGQRPVPHSAQLSNRAKEKHIHSKGYIHRGATFKQSIMRSSDGEVNSLLAQ